MMPAPPPTSSPPSVVYRRPTRLDLVAGVFLLATVVLHVAAMFPAYFAIDHQSLASQSDEAALYAILAAAWALPLVVGLSGPGRLPIAAALAAGIAATELGFRQADLGEVFRYGSNQAGAGMWLMVAAWVIGAMAAALTVAAARRHTRAAPPATSPAIGDPAAGTREGWTVGVVIVALIVAGAFLPPWDRYRVHSGVTGRSLVRNLGNGFANPWQVTLGNVLVVAALAAIPIIAIRMKNRHVAAALGCGSLLVLAAQLVSAVVQVDIPVDPAQLGLTPAQVAQLDLSLTLKLSGWFVLEALAAFGLFAALMVWATLRVHENSPGTLPSAPEARRDAIPWLS